jgi:hypothetical protein
MRKPDEIHKETGHFVPMETRKEVAKEIKRSHFTLGNDGGTIFISLNPFRGLETQELGNKLRTELEH